jgi:Chaperone of endosialidase
MPHTQALSSTSSDQRLKTDITSLDASSSLAALEALNPVSYTPIDQNDGQNLGFIAQQVAPIFPELVSTT